MRIVDSIKVFLTLPKTRKWLIVYDKKIVRYLNILSSKYKVTTLDIKLQPHLEYFFLIIKSYLSANPTINENSKNEQGVLVGKSTKA